jgi:lysophospholipase L1-like esterase
MEEDIADHLSLEGHIMKNLLMGILVSLLAIAAVLSAGELAVRLFYPLIANYDTEMWRYASYGKVLTNVTERSHRNRPGAHFDSLYGVKVDINSKGMRDFEYAYEKPPGTFRILVLGDSVTFGWGVPMEDTYPKMLEKELNARGGGVHYQVLNAGTGNYGTREEAVFLREEGLKYSPDMIILAFFVNDAEMIAPVRQYGIKRHSYLYAFLWSKWNAVTTKLDPGKMFLNYYRGMYADGSGARADFEKYAGEIKRTAREKKIPLLVAMVPDVRQIKDYPFTGIYGYVGGLFKGEPDVKVLDLTPYFDANVDPSVYWVSREDAHPNALAHGIIADALYPEILKIVERRYGK